MSKLIVTTCSDDRMGRKEGLYAATQEKIEHIIRNNPQLGVDDVKSWRWEDVAKTEWYENNKVLLDNVDAARNGRAYKPYIILSALEELKEGDFVVYTDCSPEMWNMSHDIVLPAMYYNTDVIKRLCVSNNNILSIFVKWDTVDIKSGELGKHTHRWFTLNRCMNKMGMREYEDCFMGASGMWCIRKTEDTMAFVKEWLKWNTDQDCCSLGRVDVEDDYSFLAEESDEEFGKEGAKMGHRHDQSISGLLLNKRGAKLVDILYNDMNPYNFLQYCRTDVGFKFISSIPVIEDNIINIGDVVENEKGIRMKVWKKEGGNYVVGKSRGSMYSTTKDKLKLIK